MPIILVIDDHPAICFAVKAMLSPLAEDRIHTATSGANALSSIKTHQPDLVILDIMLNKMDGLQLLQQIHRLSPAIRVVVYTSLATETYALRALRAGAAGFYNKDADIRHLVPLCQMVLQGYNCFPHATLASLTATPATQNDRSDPLTSLSDRELTVLRYLSSGMSNKDIADRLLLSNKTISTYKRRLLAKLQKEDIAGLAALLHPEDEQNGG